MCIPMPYCLIGGTIGGSVDGAIAFVSRVVGCGLRQPIRQSRVGCRSPARPALSAQRLLEGRQSAERVYILPKGRIDALRSYQFVAADL